MRVDGRAHAAVARAVTLGRLTPVAELTCLDCGLPAAADHHHRGYARKNWLEVIALCARCHRRRHPVDQRNRRRPDDALKVLSVRLPRDVRDGMRAAAVAERRSLNATMLIALEEYIRQLQSRRPRAADAR